MPFCPTPAFAVDYVDFCLSACGPCMCTHTQRAAVVAAYQAQLAAEAAATAAAGGEVSLAAPGACVFATTCPCLRVAVTG